MLDDFREQAGSSSFLTEEGEPASTEEHIRRERTFLGLSPAQRFVIVLLLMLITCVLGTFCLLVTDRVVLPFL